MRNSSGDMGEPCGVPTSTGALLPGAPWKIRVQDRSEKKEVTQSVMYEGMFPARRRDLSFDALTLSKPAFMSSKRVETAHRGRWRVRTSWMRVAHASEVLGPGREPHWLGWRRPARRARVKSRTVMILSSILQTVLRRTIKRKDAGVSYEGLPGLSRMTPFACLRQGGWYPKETRGERSSKRIAEFMAFTLFQTR